ncbi:MAG: Nif3-like dinuclear metal center hexameric protein [Tissierellia bacterium]|nr:Nif3-like dinuclear metal center hexameric protein [Tissierellia bacterium]
MKVKDIFEFIDDFAPFTSQEEFDNSGMLLGNMDASVSKILFTLDVSIEGIDYAINKNCDLIVSHHPLIFEPLKQIDTSNERGQILANIIKNDISVISAHTNLDKAKRGVNFILAELVGLTEKEVLVKDSTHDGMGFGMVGNIDEVETMEYIKALKEKLNLPTVRIYNAKGKIKRLAVVGGSGASFLDDAKNAGADLLITGDLKYHDAQYAKEIGITVADFGHFYTEYKGFKYLIEELKEKFSNIEIEEFYKPYTDLGVL